LRDLRDLRLTDFRGFRDLRLTDLRDLRDLRLTDFRGLRERLRTGDGFDRRLDTFGAVLILRLLVLTIF